MKNRKRVIFVSLIIILIAIAGLYATYAINVELKEPTTTEDGMMLNFELKGGKKEINVESGKTKTFDIDITNLNNDDIKYGIVYSLENSSSLPAGVTIAQSSISENEAVGMVSKESTVSVSIVIVNESTTNVEVLLDVINGYKNGGDLIIPEGKTLIETIYDINTISLTQTKNLTITGITEQLTTSFSAENNVNNIIGVEVISEGGGTANATINGNTINVTAIGATPIIIEEEYACSENPSTTNAKSTTYCAEYGCNSGDTLNYQTCTSSYNLTGGYNNIYVCYNGAWAWNSSGERTNLTCDSGYTEGSAVCTFDSSDPTGQSCSSSQGNKTVHVTCVKPCTKTYSASCEDYDTSYSCSSNQQTLVNTTCYSCDNNFVFNKSNLTCNGTCSRDVPTYIYEIRILYK